MARKLIDPEDGVTIDVPNEPSDLLGAVRTNNRHTALQNLRDVLARTIVDCEYPRDVAALSRQLTDVLAQIEEIEKAAPEKKGSPLD